MLTALGQGATPSLWQRLHELRMPVEVLAGERDARYVALGRRIATSSRGRFTLVGGVGHRVALEAPDAVARMIGG